MIFKIMSIIHSFLSDLDSKTIVTHFLLFNNITPNTFLNNRKSFRLFLYVKKIFVIIIDIISIIIVT